MQNSNGIQVTAEFELPPHPQRHRVRDELRHIYEACDAAKSVWTVVQVALNGVNPVLAQNRAHKAFRGLRKCRLKTRVIGETLYLLRIPKTKPE